MPCDTFLHPSGDVVVFVGDAANAARSLARALERLGYTTREATSVRDVRSDGVRTPVAVVVGALPGEDPFRSVRTVRAIRGLAHALVFAWTSPSLEACAARAVAFGADDVLVQGAAEEDVVDRVAGRIARSRMLHDRASFDCVTQMRGRLFVYESLQSEIAHALGEHGHATLAVVRLSGFTSARAEVGLLASEREVEKASFRLAGGLRSHDVPCRVADDTFMVLMPGLCRAGAAELLEPARMRIVERVLSRGDILTGYAEAPHDGTTWEQLFERAERAMAMGAARPRAIAPSGGSAPGSLGSVLDAQGA